MIQRAVTDDKSDGKSALLQAKSLTSFIINDSNTRTG